MTIDWNKILMEMLAAMLELAPRLWPLWVAVAAVWLVKFGFRYLERRRLIRSGIGDIDRMDGLTFEKYLETLFTRLGYRVERTRYRGDYGADLVVLKDGVSSVLQAKRHQRRIGVKAVQEVVAAKAKYGCSEAMVVTNSHFTEQAKELARVNGVTLWDRERLVTALLSVRQGSPTSAAPAGEETAPAGGARRRVAGGFSDV